VHGFGQLERQIPPLRAIRVIESSVRYVSERQAVVLVTNSATAAEPYTESDLDARAGAIDMPVYVLDLAETDSPA
jgi:hypothetical protein